MPDRLRDRIAAVLKEHQAILLGYEHYTERGEAEANAALADAVIATLGLRGCTDPWHWETGEPFRCPSCGYWIGEGYVEP